ncbi:MAG: HEAT repeat domain-containing protein [Flavobacteriales bacterium]
MFTSLKIAWFRRLLRSRKITDRRKAVSGLGKVAGAAAGGLLDIAFQDPEPEVRWSALVALIDRKSPSLQDQLKHARYDPNPLVRLAALRHDLNEGSAIAMACAIHSVKDSNEAIRDLAIDALTSTFKGQPKAALAMLKLANHGSGWDSWEAKRRMHMFSNDTMREALRQEQLEKLAQEGLKRLERDRQDALDRRLGRDSLVERMQHSSFPDSRGQSDRSVMN